MTPTHLRRDREIDARQFNGSLQSAVGIVRWLSDAVGRGDVGEFSFIDNEVQDLRVRTSSESVFPTSERLVDTQVCVAAAAWIRQRIQGEMSSGLRGHDQLWSIADALDPPVKQSVPLVTLDAGDGTVWHPTHAEFEELRAVGGSESASIRARALLVINEILSQFCAGKSLDDD